MGEQRGEHDSYWTEDVGLFEGTFRYIHGEPCCKSQDRMVSPVVWPVISTALLTAPGFPPAQPPGV